MQANREGVFLATIEDRSVAQTGPSKLVTFTAVYKLIEEFDGQGYCDITGEGLTITGYHYLEKKDGSLNKFTLDKLKEALGWDGRDVFWLEESIPTDTVVKLTLEAESYNGRQTIKVKYLDRKDSSGGGIVRASDADRVAIKNKLGSKLRAMSSGTPVKTPMPSRPLASQATQPKMATQEEAWAAFCALLPTTFDEEKAADRWSQILNDLFPDRPDESLTPADWGRVMAEGPKLFTPF